MKYPNLTASLALACLGVITPVAEATPATYAHDNLFLGFRASGGTRCYLVNIGPATQFTNPASSSFQLNLGTIKPDLDEVFGSGLLAEGWSSNLNVFWGISGTSGSFAAVGADPAKTIYATHAQSPLGTRAAPWIIASSTLRGTTTTKMVSLATAFITYQVTATSNNGVIQNVSDANSYASYQPGGTAPNSQGISFAAFQPSNEGNFGDTTAGTALDLFRIPNTADPGGHVGTFTINSEGVVTFTAPSTPSQAPTDPALTYNGSSAELTFKGAASSPYRVQRSTDLHTWTTIATPTSSAAGVVSYTDPSPPAGTAYYRGATP